MQVLMTVLIAVVMIGAAMLFMGLGVLLRGRQMRAGCGGHGRDSGACESCGRETGPGHAEKCERHGA